MITRFSQQALVDASAEREGQVQFDVSEERNEQCEELLRLARVKLLFSHDITASRSAFEQTPQTACVDMRLMLSFEPGRYRSHKEELALLSSHMRTVFSITRARDVVRSGYPSEPILAEAAARQLHHWAKLEGSCTNPMLKILDANLTSDLLSRGELGEVAARLLLLTARDKAAVKAHGLDEPRLSFSKPVSVILFLEELLSEEVASNFLDSFPNNIAKGDPKYITLRQAFEFSVINFSHFAKFADDSAMSQDAALASFIRSMAIIPRNNAPIVDGKIPAVLDYRKPLSPDNMVEIGWQAKLRSTSGSTASTEYRVEEIKFFPKPSKDDKPDRRPYITIVMKLGVSQSIPLPATTPTNPHSKVAQKVIAIMNDPSSWEYITPSTPSTGNETYTLLENKTHHSDHHPRYSIFLNGCSPNLYKVIHPDETNDYRRILQRGDLLGDHPRQELDALRGVRMQKPFFSVGICFHWIANAVLNPLRSLKAYHQS
jgi:hypothetical protein